MAMQIFYLELLLEPKLSINIKNKLERIFCPHIKH